MAKQNHSAPEVLLLKTRLVHDFSEDELRIFQQDAQLGSETTIIRDFLAPSDMTLYALHFALQRAYGWQNSHLHDFVLPPDMQKQLAGTIEDWQKHCGILFRSVSMDDEGHFWMDDYQSGNLRLWLRKKYTGPYIHENPWETKARCQKEAAETVAHYYQVRKTNEADSKLAPEEWYLSVFDGNPFELLERLSLKELMEMGYADLIYHYDFGDGWKIAIEIQEPYGVKEELVSRAFQQYRPVCVRRVGLPLLDDAGGTYGYFRFLRSLHIDGKTKKDNNTFYTDEYGVRMNEDDLEMYTDRQSSLESASIFGWKEKLQVPKEMF